ncbi:CCC motif membrane protein [uncultured Maribacter sp.]|uniref:CCC motif membrane protein n=1 Tax=uncultured Maribacter sp. TaxID=431308 RepID=UPI00262021F2|nr:CCC motif membrane protein [uncultured Maribacter sp.]
MDQQKLPNTGAIIGLSIASILLCWCYGVLGLLLAIVALILAIKSTKLYNAEPELYSDFNSVKTGKILAIIGIVLNLLFLLFCVWFIFSIIGLDALENEELMRERVEEYFNK